MKKKVFAIILSALVLTSTATMFSGCGSKGESTPDEVAVMATVDETTENQTESVEATEVTVPEKVKEEIDKGNLKVDDKGNITDKSGKPVEVKDGKISLKTDDGKTVTIKADDVKQAVVSNKNTSNKNTSSNNTSNKNKGNNTSVKATEPKETQKTTQKVTQPATKATEKPKEKVWVKDYKEVQVKVVDKPASTEPIYGWVSYDICNQCGAKIPADCSEEEFFNHFDGKNHFSYKVVDEKVQVGTKEIPEEYHYETKKVEDGGHWEYR